MADKLKVEGCADKENSKSEKQTFSTDQPRIEDDDDRRSFGSLLTHVTALSFDLSSCNSGSECDDLPVATASSSKEDLERLGDVERCASKISRWFDKGQQQ